MFKTLCPAHFVQTTANRASDALARLRDADEISLPDTRLCVRSATRSKWKRHGARERLSRRGAADSVNSAYAPSAVSRNIHDGMAKPRTAPQSRRRHQRPIHGNKRSKKSGA
eukprot:2928751-Pleurochrysis_carterae.AAC.3